MYEGPEGCAKEPLPAKTSEPVLEAAKCLLTPKSKGAGWTLLELGPESWFRHSSQDCHFCLALTVGSSRSHILVPLNAVHEGTAKELNSLDSASLNQICASVRRKLDAEATAAAASFQVWVAVLVSKCLESRGGQQKPRKCKASFFGFLHQPGPQPVEFVKLARGAGLRAQTEHSNTAARGISEDCSLGKG